MSGAYTRQTGNRNSQLKSKNLRTVWLQVSWHEIPTRYDKAEVIRVPLDPGCILDSSGSLKKKKIPPCSHTPRPIRLEFLGVGPTLWNALKSSPGDFNMHLGVGTTEFQVGSQNASLKG